MDSIREVARKNGDPSDVRPEWGYRKLLAAIRAELWEQNALSATLFPTVLVYGASHAGLAVVAGQLARLLASSPEGREALGEPAFEAIAVSAWTLLNLGLLAAFVKAITGTFMTYCETRLAGAVGERFRNRAARALLSTGSALPEPQVTARLAVRVTEVETGARLGILGAVRAAAQLVPLGAALFWISGPAATAAFAVLGGFGIVVSRVRGRLRRAHGRAQSVAERLHASIDELVRHGDLWRTYGATKRIAGHVAGLGRRATRARARVEAGRAALSGSNEVLGVLALLGVVAIGRTAGPALTDGQVLSFFAIFFLAYRPLRDLADAGSHAERAAAAAEALDSLSTRQSTAPPAAAESSGFTEPAPMSLVAFGAQRGGPRIDARVAPRTLVCLWGPTGSGKTTLFRALLGLEPSTGRLKLGTADLSFAGVGPAQRPFAWVPQDAPIVTANWEENVALAARSSADVAAALSLAGAWAITDEAGSERLGPGGRPLSGGQRRLLCLVRAIATGAPVLLLDEPTEGLDPAAQARIVEALRELARERTVIVATHNTAVSAVADQIVEIPTGALEAPAKRTA